MEWKSASGPSKHGPIPPPLPFERGGVTMDPPPFTSQRWGVGCKPTPSPLFMIKGGGGTPPLWP